MDPKLKKDVVKKNVVACVSEIEVLLELLKGGQSSEDRWVLIERLTGLTSRAEGALVAAQLGAMRAVLAQAASMAKALSKNANLIAKT